MDEFLNALKNGKKLIINSTTYDLAGNIRKYVNSIEKVTDNYTIDYFGTDELYNMKSHTICSNDWLKLNEVKKRLEFMKENCIEFNIIIEPN